MKALVLSGGGARGAAHIGAIKALEEWGYVPDMIVGVSIGAVVGAGYALLKDARKLEEYSRLVYEKSRKMKLSMDRILSGALSKLIVKFGCWYMNTVKSAFPSKVYFKMFRKVFKDRRFEDTLIEFHAVATDLKTGEVVVLSHGNLMKALEASMAIPGIFPPVEIDGHLLIDGGTANNLPVDIARGLGADHVIAVDLSRRIKRPVSKTANSYMTFIDSFRDEIFHEDLREGADILIKPPVDDVDSLDFTKSLKLLERTYRYTKELLNDLEHTE